MAECDEIINRLNQRASGVLSLIPRECQKTLDWLDSYREEFLAKIQQLNSESSMVPILPKTPMKKRSKRRLVSSSTDDENQNFSKTENRTNITDISATSGKPKRGARKAAEEKINEQSKMSLKTKMRRPGTEDTALNDISNNSIRVNIKSEKKSASPIKESAPRLEIIPEPEIVKKENMPPPALKPKRARKKIKKEVDSSDTENECNTRTTRSKRVVNTTSSSSTRSTRTRTTSRSRKDSDVILEEVPVPVVVIVDSDTDVTASQVNSELENNTVESKPVETEDDDDLPLKPRATRKKTKKSETKTKKTQKTKLIEPTEDSIYEDALPGINKDIEVEKDKNKNDCSEKDKAAKNINCTVTLEKVSLNSTHVIRKDAKNSLSNVTHNVQKDSMNLPLNTTHVIDTHTLNETHVISKDNDPAISRNTLTKPCAVVLQKMNETMTLSTANKTVTLSHKDNGVQWKKADIPLAVDNLLTDDDESFVKKTPEKKTQPPRKGIKTKQMFSPYASDPVKKRVAAFEKLIPNEANDAPTRVTRTKTRNMEKEKENKARAESSSRIPAKSRYFTPTANNKLPSLIPQSDSKTMRNGTTGNNKNTSILPVKSASAAKPSRAEIQIRREEEQKRRLEKEEDAKRKREAMMHAKAEEQRKKREEKQLKAQKAREEMEREKEEKLRQLLQEKEEEQQKKREWQAKKLAEIEERRKAEEQCKMMQREQERQRQLQEEKRRKMLATKPPPLPTDDCEDSDSSTETVTKKYIKPEWARSQNLCRTLLIQRYINKSRFEALFQMEATTPDLREIFETVDERILRRNSSAVWRTPPRYSTLPKF